MQEDPLANIKSAIKRIRSSERKQQHNRVTRGRTRSAVKGARQALADGKQDKAKAEVSKALVELDHAAGKGIIHKNNAARRKARLMKQLNKLEQNK
jgi:small subunit ribosomal protein S20